MNKAEQQLISLLRSGLWDNAPDRELFTETLVDWESIILLADQHTVSGVVFDGVEKLPSEQQPPPALMRKLYQTVVRIEHSHNFLNQRLEEVVSMFYANEVRPVLLKGQGVAQLYPKPERRQCGDIDLYIGEEDYRKACIIMQEASKEKDNGVESQKHCQLMWNGVVVELHRIADDLFWVRSNAAFQRWTKKHLLGDAPQQWTVGNTTILLPPPNFNALYIFNHAYRHFIVGGIGLRQLCDWTLYLHRYNDLIDRRQLLSDLKSFGLYHGWQVFGCIAVNQLGLPESQYPFYTKKYKVAAKKILFEVILPSGNFGFYSPQIKKRPPGYLTGKLHSMFNTQKRLVKLFPYFPKYVAMYLLYFWNRGISNVLKDINPMLKKWS